MTTILRIDASSRDQGSASRTLGDHLEQSLIARIPGAQPIRRDLATEPPPHVESATIIGYYTPPEAMTDVLRQATALSDALIAELRSADILLLTTPMYNFSVPSALKAWIDQVVRIGHTFSYDGANFTGLLTGKKAYVAWAVMRPGPPLRRRISSNPICGSC
jgi:FMN-dependent NADH-azoreductase